jgi:hypothetical protein
MVHCTIFPFWGLIGIYFGFLVQSTAQAAIFFACVKIFFDIILFLPRRRLGDVVVVAGRRRGDEKTCHQKNIFIYC